MTTMRINGYLLGLIFCLTACSASDIEAVTIESRQQPALPQDSSTEAGKRKQDTTKTLTEADTSQDSSDVQVAPESPGSGSDTPQNNIDESDQDTSKSVSSRPPAECANPAPAWIFCDDFEKDRLKEYFEYDNPQNSFVRTQGAGVDGSWGMQVSFAQGQVNAGSLKLAFGKTPDKYMKPIDAGTEKFNEVYWRMYIRNDSGWTGGGGDKLSRAQSLASKDWAQAMMAAVWSGSGGDRDHLVIDPATGINNIGDLAATRYNDFANQKYLGMVKSSTPLFHTSNVGKWHCVEARVKLNEAGRNNGIFTLWINDKLEASKTDINWLGVYSEYGINAIFFENYWNDGSTKSQKRYIDRIVVSRSKIGC